MSIKVKPVCTRWLMHFLSVSLSLTLSLHFFFFLYKWLLFYMPDTLFLFISSLLFSFFILISLVFPLSPLWLHAYLISLKVLLSLLHPDSTTFFLRDHTEQHVLKSVIGEHGESQWLSTYKMNLSIYKEFSRIRNGLNLFRYKLQTYC